MTTPSGHAPAPYPTTSHIPTPYSTIAQQQTPGGYQVGGYAYDLRCVLKNSEYIYIYIYICMSFDFWLFSVLYSYVSLWALK